MSEETKYRNVFRGIIVSGVITFVAYLITSIISFVVGYFVLPGLFLFADLQFLLGSFFGVLYFMKMRRRDQSILLYGIVVGVVGGIVGAFFIAIYQWILLINIIYFAIYFFPSLISGAFMGFLVGVLISVYYMYKQVKEETPERKADEEFFKDLIEDES
ncbi:MAG: hypothetical protein ACFFDF_05710 [Candidatus Odinarchaeota archaeon]